MRELVRLMVKTRLYLTFFIFGFLSCFALFYFMFYSNFEVPFTGFVVSEGSLPSDRIQSEQIVVFDDEILLLIGGAKLVNYAPTGSMSPILGGNSNGIVISPTNSSDVLVGDIVTFRDFDRLVVHRVVEKGEDGEGIYFITKGDNSDFVDGKIRFSDIEHVLVGILY